VLRGIRRAQASGDVSEYNVARITVEADRLGEKAAFEWLVRYPKLYLQGVFDGFIEDS